jgi:dihydrofolate synthase/folylpolyglutamate synthase
MKTYSQVVNYLYQQIPQFQRIGAAAYKPGLGTINRLAEGFNHPELNYPVVHVAGTNGKGSVSHTIAAVLQAEGHKVGLFTSPHLIDFRERIRVNGEKISEAGVVDFMERYDTLIHIDKPGWVLNPSFFELTTMMAFDWFARQNVEIAVIEVGLGGRLDSTNIVNPILSVITNVSLDHMAQLGSRLRDIAAEKSGIMREGVEVICGDASGRMRGCFAGNASQVGAPIRFAQLEKNVSNIEVVGDEMLFHGTPFGTLHYQLTGDYQRQNGRTVIAALQSLRKMRWVLSDDSVKKGFANVATMTGLMGRWMKLSETPLVICDTGHNIGGWEIIADQLKQLPKPLTVVLGFVNDKDIDPILKILPSDAQYIFTNAAIPRALPADVLADMASQFDIQGELSTSVADAYARALQISASNGNSGSIFVGGSTYVVADLLRDVPEFAEKYSK